MKILINTSNLVIGGGIQVGVWFIAESIKRNLDVVLAVSPIVYSELVKSEVDFDEANLLVIEQSPSRDKNARKALIEYADNSSPDVIFTVFGPSYVKFKQPHLCGFADGWLSHSSFRVFKQVFRHNLMKGVNLLLTSIYKGIWMKMADELVFEADYAAEGLSKRLYLDKTKCHVVSNNCAARFHHTPVSSSENSEPFILLYFTADYAHKGIDNYLTYAQALYDLRPDQKFLFRITISSDSPSAMLILEKVAGTPLESYFDFCGYVPVKEAVGLVDASNVVMQTSYLETFSANYPEAMARQRPLLVSDFSFSRSICKHAAVYVNPDDANEVANAIIKLSDDKTMRDMLVKNGTEVLSVLPSPEERFEKYLTILKKISLEDRC